LPELVVGASDVTLEGMTASGFVEGEVAAGLGRWGSSPTCE
jgi:hypothetical protein